LESKCYAPLREPQPQSPALRQALHCRSHTHLKRRRHSLVPIKPPLHHELPAFCSGNENSWVSNGGNSRSTPRASIVSNERTATLSTPRPGCASTQTVQLYAAEPSFARRLRAHPSFVLRVLGMPDIHHEAPRAHQRQYPH